MAYVLIFILLLSGCATVDRDGRSLICFGWCWQIEGHTVVETKPIIVKEK